MKVLRSLNTLPHTQVCVKVVSVISGYRLQSNCGVQLEISAKFDTNEYHGTWMHTKIIDLECESQLRPFIHGCFGGKVLKQTLCEKKLVMKSQTQVSIVPGNADASG